MKTLLSSTFILLTSLLLSSAKLPGGQETSPIDLLGDLYLKKLFAHKPEMGTFYGVKDSDHGNLSDNTSRGIRRWQAFEDSLYGAVKAVDRRKMSRAQNITYGLLLEKLESSIKSRVCKMELWEVNQVFGWHISMDIISRAQPVGNDQSRASTLRRWRKIPAYIRNEVQNLKEASAARRSAIIFPVSVG